MAPRAFVVFEDQPAVASPKRRNPDATSASDMSFAPTTTTDKENVHPITGFCVGAKRKDSKKQKTVLAVKHESSSGKKTKAKTEPKKRKASSKGKGLSSQNSRAGSSTLRKSDGSKPSIINLSPLSSVDEETQGEIERIRQADVDERCYELTVRPLADVSEAFEAMYSWDGVATERHVDVTLDESLESHDPKYSSFVRSRAPSPSPAPSTPKTCITSFTFSSPSRSGERYRRTKSVPISSEEELFRL